MNRVHDRALRPAALADVVGQRPVVQRLKLALDAANARGEPLEHVLLSGPPGLGKTTLSYVVAHEIGCGIVETSAPVLRTVEQVTKILLGIGHREVLFIDEIHRLSPEIEEFLYSAMEDWTIPVEFYGKSRSIPLAPFTLIGATTLSAHLSAPLRNRFGFEFAMEFYSADELSTLVAANAAKLGMRIDPVAALELAGRARGTPRIANRLLRRSRDWSQTHGESYISIVAARAAMESEQVDDDGLNPLDRSYLRTLVDFYKGGPAGVNALASTLGHEQSTLADVVEPFLLRVGMITRTPRGRVITDKGKAVLV